MANDVTKERNFVLGLETPDMVTNQFQRADTAPRDPSTNTWGDGVLDATDVVITRQYNLGLLPLSPVGGPVWPVAMRSPNTLWDGFFRPARSLRAGSAGAKPGDEVTIQFIMDSQGDELATSFSLNFDPEALAFVSASLGSGVYDGTFLTLNSGRAADGEVGVLIDSNYPFMAGTHVILSVTFRIPETATAGLHQVDISDSVVRRSVSDSDGKSLPLTYGSGEVLIGTGRSVRK